jgi:L-histidine Nalpha-methyltransferase
VHLIGLGCGGGQKDARLLSLIRTRGCEVSYTPCDVSTAMVLVAREAALTIVKDEQCFPLVCDLATASDLTEVLAEYAASRARLITFFGMIPNFEPGDILPKLASLVRPDDTLLFSANLAPGPDYAAGLERILPQYDNALTHDWLLTFLRDLGVERDAGELRFGVEECDGLRRVVARFHFSRATDIQLEGERFNFQASETMRLFFSYRYTPVLIQRKLEAQGLRVQNQWITASGEEGVFLCQRR